MMPTFCSVVGCGSSDERDRVSLFSLPSSRNTFGIEDPVRLKRRKEWLTALRKGDLTFSKIRNIKVCSKHFVNGKPSQSVEDIDWVPTVKMGYRSRECSIVNGDTNSRSSNSLKKNNKNRRKCLLPGYIRADDEEENPSAYHWIDGNEIIKHVSCVSVEDLKESNDPNWKKVCVVYEEEVESPDDIISKEQLNQEFKIESVYSPEKCHHSRETQDEHNGEIYSFTDFVLQKLKTFPKSSRCSVQEEICERLFKTERLLNVDYYNCSPNVGRFS